jgi:predicted nucleic acid-binding protein
MKITIDTSAILAVLLDEPEKDMLISLTAGVTLLSPSSLPMEIGNALSNLLKRDKISLKQAQHVVKSFVEIPVQMSEVNIQHSLEISHYAKIYAYDAYMLSCALEHKCPLLTLDRGLQETAKKLKCKTIEVKL